MYLYHYCCLVACLESQWRRTSKRKRGGSCSYGNVCWSLISFLAVFTNSCHSLLPSIKKKWLLEGQLLHMKFFFLLGEMAYEEFSVLQKGWQLLNRKPTLQTSLRTVYIELKIIGDRWIMCGCGTGKERKKKQVMGGDPSPLLITSKAPPALLHSSVGYPVQESCRATG